MFDTTIITYKCSYNNRNVILLLASIPIKSIPERKKIFCSLITTSIKEGDCSDSWKFVASHCVNGSSQIKGIDFDQSYSPVAHDDPFRINIAIADMHRLTAMILDVSNAFQNTNVTIHERVCVSPPPYYIAWFEISYPNVPLNINDGQVCPQCMNGIQGTKQSGRQWNRLLDSVVKMIKYKKSTIDHAIYINVFTDGTVSYLTVSTDNVLNTTNNETKFPELTRFFK